MKLPSYLQVSRHYVFRFRRRVPDDLRHHFAINELRCSLSTKEKSKAVSMARVLAIKTDIIFDRLRHMTEKKKDKDFLRIDLIWKADLSELGNFEIEYDPERPGEKEEAQRQIDRIQALQLQRLSTTAPPARPTGTEVERKLSELIGDFLSGEEVKRRKNSPATVRRDSDALKLFQATIGRDLPMREVTQQHAVDYQRELARRGLADNTINNHLGALSKFSKWVDACRPSVGHKRLTVDALRVRVDKRPDEQRPAFTVDEVKRILGHIDMPSFKIKEPHKFWLPHIAAYSGMRVEEIAQLDPAGDIHQDDAGIWVFDVNDREGRSLKNPASRRLVPIHPALLKHGLLDYAERLQQRGAKQLFPYTKARDGRLGKNAAKTVNRFIQVRVGIAKSLHAFRHCVATVLKHARVEEAIAAALLGHAHGGITFGRYGKRYLSEVLWQEAVSKIRYGLDQEWDDLGKVSG